MLSKVRVQRRISEIESAVLVAVQHSPREPIQKIARRCACSPDTVHRAIQSLTERGILQGITPLINLNPLGFIDLSIFITLAPRATKEREEILAELIKEPRISWIAVLGGEFEIGLLIAARNAEDAWGVLQALSEKLGPFIGKKSIVVRRSFTAYGRRHIAPHIKAPEPFTIKDNCSRIELDPFDRKLLGMLASGNELSGRSLAQKFGVAHSTIDRRIKHLEQSGIISGFIYRVNPGPLGVSTFRLMISCAGVDRESSEIIREFCDESPFVIKLFENIGAWDYEIEIDANLPEDVQKMSSQLSRKLGKRIERVGMFQLFRQLKYVGFSPQAFPQMARLDTD